LGTCRITLYLGKEVIVFMCGYGTNKGNLDPYQSGPVIRSTDRPYGT
jgi:hypothetical protein